MVREYRRPAREPARRRPCAEHPLSLPSADTFLKPGVPLDAWKTQTRAMSDNEAAQHSSEARQRQFLSLHKRSRTAA